MEDDHAFSLQPTTTADQHKVEGNLTATQLAPTEQTDPAPTADDQMVIEPAAAAATTTAAATTAATTVESTTATTTTTVETDQVKAFNKPETLLEQEVYSILSAPIRTLGCKYEPNPFEHLPSRFLSLVPHPFGCLTRLAIATAAESINLSQTELEAVRKKIGVPTAAPDTPRKKGGKTINPLTSTVAATFTDVTNVTLQTVAQIKSNKKVVAVRQIIPDRRLAENIYSCAALTMDKKDKYGPGSFILISPATSQGCLYLPTTKLPPDLSIGPHDTFGVPNEMFTIQQLSHQAPKRWLLMAKTKGGENGSDCGHVCEIAGKRISLSRDRELSVESNASIHLKVEKRRRIQ